MNVFFFLCLMRCVVTGITLMGPIIAAYVTLIAMDASYWGHTHQILIHNRDSLGSLHVAMVTRRPQQVAQFTTKSISLKLFAHLTFILCIRLYAGQVFFLQWLKQGGLWVREKRRGKKNY